MPQVPSDDGDDDDGDGGDGDGGNDGDDGGDALANLQPLLLRVHCSDFDAHHPNQTSS